MVNETPSKLETAAPVIDPAPYWTIAEERFGIPRSTFDAFTLVQPGKKKVYIIPQDHAPPTRPEPHTIGMPFMRVKMKYPKLTTAAAMQFGPAATRNVVPVGDEQARAYLTREPFVASAPQLESCAGRGYVLIRRDDWVLGVGFLELDADESGVVKSMFPKSRVRPLE